MSKYPVPRGVFWADYIKTLKDDPEGRLQVARRYMPLPGAFREAAIALRAKIRKGRKNNEDCGELLRELYRTAAQENFLLATPFIEGTGPGFNVAKKIPRSQWEALDYPYFEIGYEQLPLVNGTDKKWFVAEWGEPTRHQSAQGFYSREWAIALEKTKSTFSKRDRKMKNNIDQLNENENARVTLPLEPQWTEETRSGCSVFVVILLFGIALLR